MFITSPHVTIIIMMTMMSHERAAPPPLSQGTVCGPHRAGEHDALAPGCGCGTKEMINTV